jgi:hypothetical protein
MGLPTMPLSITFRDLARDLDPERFAMLVNELGRQMPTKPVIEMDGVDENGLKFLDAMMDALLAHER